MNDGKYPNRVQLLAAVEEYYKAGLTLRHISSLCGISVRQIRHFITDNQWKREGRAVDVKPKPEPTPPAERPLLKLVPDPCLREYCEDQGCPWHYARTG